MRHLDGTRAKYHKAAKEEAFGTAMVQSVMVFAVGFLSAALLALAIMPLIHRRASRLTAARLDDAIPVSVQELRAEKDQMRAEVAISVRRLEIVIESLKKKNVAHQSEITKKTERLTALQSGLKDKNEAVATLEENTRSLQEELSVAISGRDAGAERLLEAQRSLAKKGLEIQRLEELVTEYRSRLGNQAAAAKALQKKLQKSEDLVVRLQKDLSLADDRKLSVADLHREIDQLEERVEMMAMDHTN